MYLELKGLISAFVGKKIKKLLLKNHHSVICEISKFSPKKDKIVDLIPKMLFWVKKSIFILKLATPDLSDLNFHVKEKNFDFGTKKFDLDTFRQKFLGKKTIIIFGIRILILPKHKV